MKKDYFLKLIEPLDGNTKQELTECFDALESNTGDLIELSRWLMGYLMVLHDFRSKATHVGVFGKPVGFHSEALMK